MGEIKGTDVFDKSAIQAPLEFAKNMDVALDKIDKFIATMKKSESAIGVAKSTKTITKENSNLLESQKELQKIEKQISSARGKLIASRSKESKQLAELKVQTTERNKKLRDEAKAARGLIGAFDKLNKERTEAKKLLRDLIAGQKASNEEIEKAQKAFDGLDESVKKANKSVGDGTLDVGRYEDGIRAASEGNEAFKGSSTEILQNFISINQEQGGVKNFFKSFVGGIQSATKAGLRFIATPIGAIIAAIVAGIAAITAVISRNESASDKFNEIWEATTAILDVVVGRIIKLITAFIKFTTGDFKGAVNDVKGAFSNLGDAILEAGKRGVQIARLRVEVEKLNTVLKVTESALDAQIRKFEILADDATRSFKERENAAKEARKLNTLLAQERENVARKELLLVNEQVKQAIAAGTINRTLRDQEADAIAKFVQIQGEALAIDLDNEKTRRELKQDRLERDLDILIDGFDNIKTINDRIIEDDTRVLSERVEAFNSLTDLSDKSFAKQIEIIKRFTKVSFDENELLDEQDAVILNEKIRRLGLSEIIEGRLLEIVRERRIVTSELGDQERELTAIQVAQSKALINDIRKAGIEKLQLRIEEQDALDILIDEEIKNAQQLSDELLEINKKRIDQQNEDERKAQEQRREIVAESLELSKEALGTFTDLRIQQIGQELTAMEFARDRELEKVKGNKRAEGEINKRFDAQRRDLERKQANTAKANALFQIAINTAVAITKITAEAALASPFLIPGIIASGVLQAGAVLAAPLPQFDEGITSTPKDYVAGEKRPELRRSGGRWSVVNEPTMFRNSPGDTIISGKETDSILGSMADLTGKNLLTDPSLVLGLLNNNVSQKNDTDLAYVIEKGNEKVASAITKKKLVNVHVNTRRARVIERHGNTYVHRIDTDYGD